MAIDREGFLSADISTWIEKHRQENREWFDLAVHLNRVAQEQVAQLQTTSDPQAFTAALLFLRGLSTFQGAVLMAERGMTQEARTLARSCFEVVFFLGALNKTPDFVGKLAADDADRRGKLARSLLKLPSGLEAEQVTKLQQFLAQLEVEPEPLTVSEAARLAGLTEIYDTYYRGLSNDSSHPSITALNRHVEVDNAGVVTGFKWGPDVGDVGNALNTACTACVYLLFFATQLFKQVAIFKAFEPCWTTYKSLVEASLSRTTPTSGTRTSNTR